VPLVAARVRAHDGQESASLPRRTRCKVAIGYQGVQEAISGP